MCRAVMMLVTRLLALVHRCQRGAVGCIGKLAGVPDDDENRREDQDPLGSESRDPRALHHGGDYRVVPLVSRNGGAARTLIRQSDAG